MNQSLQSTATIRQRGQLTIPDFIREITDWISPGSVVSVSRTRDDQILISPHTTVRKQTDWKKLRRDIELARSFKGKYKRNLSEFIVKDRENH